MDNLKSWCHWKRKEKDLSEDDEEFVDAIETTIENLEGFIVATTSWQRLYSEIKEKYDLLLKGPLEPFVVQFNSVEESEKFEREQRLEAENKVLQRALENIRYSGLSQGWCGDTTTLEEHRDYSIQVAGEALGLRDE